MNAIDLKSEVAQAIQSEWKVFEQYHPRLAAVIDQSLLKEQAMISLADDQEYQRLLAEAAGLSPALDIARGVVERVVKALIHSLG